MASRYRKRTSEELTLFKTLKTLAPGTRLHAGLENVLRARTGALIVIGDSQQVLDLVDGGFRLDAAFHPSALYELAKMDGSIILSNDVKRILYVNAQLTPDPMIPTFETGTRHRTAERVAKQTGELVVSISQRRNVITLYQGNMTYVLKDVGVIVAKANQAIATLERYKTVLVKALDHLLTLEFEEYATLGDVVTVIQRAQMVGRIAGEIEQYVAELGLEGRLVEMQLDELMSGIEGEGLLVVRDYWLEREDSSPDQVWEELSDWGSDELVDQVAVARGLGFGTQSSNPETPVIPRGFRALTKIPRLPISVIENLVRRFETLPDVLSASIEELDGVEGIGEVRAKAIREGLRRLREHSQLDRLL